MEQKLAESIIKSIDALKEAEKLMIAGNMSYYIHLFQTCEYRYLKAACKDLKQYIDFPNFPENLEKLNVKKINRLIDDVISSCHDYRAVRQAFLHHNFSGKQDDLLQIVMNYADYSNHDRGLFILPFTPFVHELEAAEAVGRIPAYRLMPISAMKIALNPSTPSQCGYGYWLERMVSKFCDTSVSELRKMNTDDAIVKICVEVIDNLFNTLGEVHNKKCELLEK